jgi:26S proteasome regulatory subunit N7
MASTRLAFWAGDWPAARAGLKRAKDLNESGGDWDRRNRLKVYEGAFLLSQRDFAGAATLLLDSIATFTATELLSYPAFVFYCCVACVKSLERPVLKKKVIDSPDVIAVLPQLPHVEALLHGLHECRYRVFLEALAGVYPRLARDRLLARHAAYFLREMRLAGYVQFLESYRSVTVEGMARKFGVSPAFIDAELSRFVAAGRVGAKIDAVRGIVETTRPDSKNAQYHEVVKKGDVLLNQIQKLSRVTTA